ncbi:heme-binding protein [Pseudomonas mosselii]|uniref:GlcG/HbpS family heme-binding protein n=1 Tax=unclassified Pseudomonas TaxID=196821 RepID=UPI0020C226D2|nr:MULTISPECIES: heme-binding protein [unclassified Pseudomonas]MCP8635314.1 heme-binding protein [Pseudomonas sp. DVZ6]MDD7783755.1 heme-binding protein [Pseudomonas sp. DVZ24]
MNIKHLLTTLLIGIPVLTQPSMAATGGDDHAPPAALQITAERARAMADAAERAARAQSVAIVISIVDNHGNLKYFQRMDGTSSGSIQVAQLKAETSARFPLSSRSLGERSAALPANPYASLPGFTLLEGGLPIMDVNGRHIGGIGISGATPELDAQFARTALEEG